VVKILVLARSKAGLCDLNLNPAPGGKHFSKASQEGTALAAVMSVCGAESMLE
jgi:hypothetical protein